MCGIVAVPVVTLRASATGEHPDPGSRVVMTGDGRYYTSSNYGQQILEWTSTGSFVRAVGKNGDGPGEFSARGGLLLFLAPGDTLFVLDGGQRWSVFDPDLLFVRSFSNDLFGRNFSSMQIIDHGILNAAASGPVGGTGSFGILGFDGRVRSRFGPAPKRTTPRLAALDSNGGIWVTPLENSAGLVLERWSAEGVLTSALQYSPPWLPEGRYPGGDASEPRLPEYDMLHVDRMGLIWVSVVVRDARWRAVSREHRKALQDELYDTRVEVIDPVAGRVIAAFRYDGPLEPIPPFARFIADADRSYRVVEDTLGLRAIEIFDIHLSSNE